MEKRSGKRIVYRVISIISLIIAIAAISAIVVIFYLYQKSSKEYADLALAARTAETQQAEAPDVPDIHGGEEPLVAIPINFDYVKSLNEDITAWIELEGTGIDYPVLYDTTVNNYYLNHNYSGTYTPYGSIFVLGCNAGDFTDFNTIVYGHNMIDGSMFAHVRRFRKRDYFDEHDKIVIYTPERKLTYKIFAAYRTDNLNITLNNDFSTPELRREYLDRVFSHDSGFYRDGVTVNEDDRIITLSTCTSSPANRFLVQGVLVSDEAGAFSTEQ
ncbi:MAG: class B sortase [Clostridia bacterium]|nr:class B sortase [Clostridia bacterium]